MRALCGSTKISSLSTSPRSSLRTCLQSWQIIVSPSFSSVWQSTHGVTFKQRGSASPSAPQRTSWKWTRRRMCTPYGQDIAGPQRITSMALAPRAMLELPKLCCHCFYRQGRPGRSTVRWCQEEQGCHTTAHAHVFKKPDPLPKNPAAAASELAHVCTLDQEAMA